MIKALSFLVSTGFCWVAVGAVVGLIGRKGFNILYYQVMSGVFGLCAGLAIYVFSPASVIPPAGLPTSTWAGVVAGGLANGLFNYLMIQFMGVAMTRGPNAIVWATIQSGLIYPFLMGWLVFGVPMNAFRAVGIVLIIASIVLYAARGGAGNGAAEGGGKIPLRVWFVPSLLGMLCCGINQCGGNLPSYLEHGQDFPSVFRTLLSNAGSLAGCLGHVLLRGACGKWPPKPRKGELASLAVYTLGLMCVGYTSTVFLQFPGLDLLKNLGAGAMGYPIMVASCIIGFFPYGLFVLREKINPIQALGAVVGVAGIILGCL